MDRKIAVTLTTVKAYLRNPLAANDGHAGGAKATSAEGHRYLAQKQPRHHQPDRTRQQEGEEQLAAVRGPSAVAEQRQHSYPGRCQRALPGSGRDGRTAPPPPPGSQPSVHGRRCPSGRLPLSKLRPALVPRVLKTVEVAVGG